jgi:glycosyltransferase involved in cell wall biosynthesis
MRIGLDLRAGSSAWLGGVYYLQNLALAVGGLPEREVDPLVALAPDGDDLCADEFEGLTRVVRYSTGGSGLVARAGARLGRRSAFATAVAATGVDVVFPAIGTDRLGRVGRVHWVPDLQHLALPAYFSDEERAGRDEGLRQLGEQAQLVVVSSDVVAGALGAHVPVLAPKLRVLRFTTVPRDEWESGDPAGTAARYGLPPRFLLLPNQFWVHKDHRAAFEAVALLHRRGVQVCLACTGGTEDYRRPGHYEELMGQVRANGLEGSIRTLGVVPRSDYVQLLRAAELLVQPSRFEGWSSVVEDARAFGKRIVLSDIDVHREQAPDGGLFFPVGDAEGLAAAIEKALAEPPVDAERDALERQRERGHEYGRAFLSIAREATTVR